MPLTQQLRQLVKVRMSGGLIGICQIGPRSTVHDLRVNELRKTQKTYRTSQAALALRSGAAFNCDVQKMRNQIRTGIGSIGFQPTRFMLEIQVVRQGLVSGLRIGAKFP